MPDQYGNMSPQEIADMGVNSLLKVRALQQQDTSVAQQAALFKQQLASGELEHKSKLLDFEVKEFIKRMLGQKEIDPATGQPKTQLLPQDMQWLSMLGFGTGPKPIDYLPPGQQTDAAKVGTGLAPSADTAASAVVTMRGQDINKGIATDQLGVEKDKLALEQHKTDAATFENFVNAGAAPNILAQGKMTDFANIAKAFEGVDPTTRINAYSNYLAAKAQYLRDFSASEYSRIESARLTADAKNKYKPLELLSTSLGRLNVSQAAQLNAGDSEGAARTSVAIANTAAALAQTMRGLGYALPPEAEPEEDFFTKIKNLFTGGGKSKTGGIDITKALNPDGTLKPGGMDIELSEGSQPSGASPQTATPTPQNPPAVGAPTSSLPLPNVDSRGNTVPYLNPDEVAQQLASLQSRQDARSAAAGKPTSPKLPLVSDRASSILPQVTWIDLAQAAMSFGNDPSGNATKGRLLLRAAGMPVSAIESLKSARDIQLALRQAALALRAQTDGVKSTSIPGL